MTRNSLLWIGCTATSAIGKHRGDHEFAVTASEPSPVASASATRQLRSRTSPGPEKFEWVPTLALSLGQSAPG